MTDIELFHEKPLLADKFTLTSTSLEISGEISGDELDYAWMKFAQVHGGTQWWIGDLYSQTKEYGRAEELATKHGFNSQTIRIYGYVSDAYRPYTRVYNSLSFKHYHVAAHLDEFYRTRFLKRAAIVIKNKIWSVAKLTEQIKKYERIRKRMERLADAPDAPRWSGEYQPNNVYIADTTEMDFIKSVPKDSMDMVFTDPPWDEDALICYETVGRLANRALKPGGFAAVYCGKMFLPEILSMLSSWLDYVWMYCVFQPDNNWSMTRSNVGIFEAWRPIALFRKPGDYREQRFAPDALKCTRQKQWHDWQQGIEPIERYIELLTEPGDIILDPFVGGATVPYAAMRLKRHYLAFDKEEETVRLALARLNGNMES